MQAKRQMRASKRGKDRGRTMKVIEEKLRVEIGDQTRWLHQKALRNSDRSNKTEPEESRQRPVVHLAAINGTASRAHQLKTRVRANLRAGLSDQRTMRQLKHIEPQGMRSTSHGAPPA